MWRHTQWGDCVFVRSWIFDEKTRWFWKDVFRFWTILMVYSTQNIFQQFDVVEM